MPDGSEDRSNNMTSLQLQTRWSSICYILYRPVWGVFEHVCVCLCVLCERVKRISKIVKFNYHGGVLRSPVIVEREKSSLHIDCVCLMNRIPKAYKRLFRFSLEIEMQLRFCTNWQYKYRVRVINRKPSFCVLSRVGFALS